MRFALYCTLVMFGFAALQWRGVNLLPTPGANEKPVSLRTSPGGYRSYHSYQSYHGFQGGK